MRLVLACIASLACLCIRRCLVPADGALCADATADVSPRCTVRTIACTCTTASLSSGRARKGRAALAFTFAELVLIITGRPTADAATAAGVHGLVVSSWAVKAVCRSVYCRVLADGTAAAFVKVQRGLELAHWALPLLLGCNICQVRTNQRCHWALGPRYACRNKARRALSSAIQARLAVELPVSTFSTSGAVSCARSWSVVAAWALGAVDGDVGLSTAREAIPTLWAIGARVQTVCTALVCTHNTLVAAF